MKRVHCAPAQTLQIITSKYKKDGYNRNIAFGEKGWFLLLPFLVFSFLSSPHSYYAFRTTGRKQRHMTSYDLGFPAKKEAKKILMPFSQINIFR